jgi:NAD(P)-dependent dehydrogenase (short-subunit alcohol dehydrogenase family)
MTSPVSDSSAYLAEHFALHGRLAVVTGGSSGIGLGIARALARAGADVALVARTASTLAAAVSEIDTASGGPGTTRVFAADLADRSELARVADGIITAVGAPAILVNAAAINLRPPMAELTDDEWDRTLDLNLTAPFLLGQRFAPGMADAHYGRIINLASQQAIRAFGNSGAYGASKAGIVGLTRSQAEAWAPSGITANAISPAFVETPSTAAVFSDPNVSDAMAARTMTGSNGVVADVEGLAVFLAGPSARAITGQLIYADAGFSVH